MGIPVSEFNIACTRDCICFKTQKLTKKYKQQQRISANGSGFFCICWYSVPSRKSTEAARRLFVQTGDCLTSQQVHCSLFCIAICRSTKETKLDLLVSSMPEKWKNEPQVGDPQTPCSLYRLRSSSNCAVTLIMMIINYYVKLCIPARKGVVWL